MCEDRSGWRPFGTYTQRVNDEHWAKVIEEGAKVFKGEITEDQKGNTHTHTHTKKETKKLFSLLFFTVEHICVVFHWREQRVGRARMVLIDPGDETLLAAVGTTLGGLERGGGSTP